jgi:hypothetical protein
MARPRSLLVSMEFTAAGRAHNCRHNSSHRIQKGDSRLTIRSDGDEHHYCLICGKTFLAKDVQRLQALLLEAEALSSKTEVSTT